ncbi:T9SS type A sorting domain-containing protein [uncultured Lacinutrix sp.]|uniref:T9SS type A sorting domain-containing protein n=1 Tax=uncultured Lacinutrix sp. TaxID=574032 RepID=UPI002611A14E|nr:T9SS type A sorting domain-containing protein [uncultured Lacinutrix sp.]
MKKTTLLIFTLLFSLVFYAQTNTNEVVGSSNSVDQEQVKFSIFPNPGNDKMNIDVSFLSNDGLKVDVFDVLGKKVLSETLSDLNTKINISKWNSGLYLVRLTSLNQKQDIKLTKRFVKL